jgi:hypothetical protein
MSNHINVCVTYKHLSKSAISDTYLSLSKKVRKFLWYAIHYLRHITVTIVKSDKYESGTKNYLFHILGSHAQVPLRYCPLYIFQFGSRNVAVETTKKKFLQLIRIPILLWYKLNDFSLTPISPVPSITGYPSIWSSSDPVIYMIPFLLYKRADPGFSIFGVLEPNLSRLPVPFVPT